MRFWDSDEYRHTDEVRLLHTGPRLSREQGHHIFREMVRSEARNGRLSPLRRRRLIQYAAALQLAPLEASKIVTEISDEVHAEFGPAPWHYRLVEGAVPTRWPMWVKVALTLLAAFVVDRLVRQLI
jgi:hypothetical protein